MIGKTIAYRQVATSMSRHACLRQSERPSSPRLLGRNRCRSSQLPTSKVSAVLFGSSGHPVEFWLRVARARPVVPGIGCLYRSSHRYCAHSSSAHDRTLPCARGPTIPATPLRAAAAVHKRNTQQVLLADRRWRARPTNRAADLPLFREPSYHALSRQDAARRADLGTYQA